MNEVFKDLIKDSLEKSLEKRGVSERGFARAPVSFPVRYQMVSEDDIESLRHTYLDKPTRERPQESGIVSGGEVNFVDHQMQELIEDGIKGR